MTGEASSEITLRALEGEPLKHDNIRKMVIATAHAIAERQGVRVIDIQTTPDAITARLETGRIEAIGFAAELWGEADRDVYDAGEEWKSA